MNWKGVPTIAASLLGLALAVRPAAAWVTLMDNDKGKAELETRLMFWGVDAGKDLVPSGATAQTERVEDFYVRRARLLLRLRLPPKMEIYAQFGQDNIGSKVATPDTGFRVKDIYLNYKSAEAFQVTVGQFKVPFLRQNLESGFNQLLVDRADLPGLRPASEGSRDRGAMFWGNAGRFQYRAALFDGSDQETTNAHSSLRGAGRVSYNWFTPETEAGYTGTSLGRKRILQMGLQADVQNGRLDAKDDAGFTTQRRNYDAWAADLFFDQPFKDGSAFTFEGARLDRSDRYDNTTLAKRELTGYYAQAGYLLPWKIGAVRLQFAAREEDLHTDRGAADGSVENRTVGLAFFSTGHDRKVQIDYTNRRTEPVDLEDNQLRVSVIATF
ncbi:MAG TPA: selenite/tellurite reduction operon porin ExtI [Candidatus Polarisedimenticolia bacterium]